MFDQIAERYDLLNRVLSLGVDQGWRRKLLEALAIPAHGRVLDHATGTADLALQLARRFPDANVVGLDPSPRMLEHGRVKVVAAGLADRIELGQGDAQDLSAFPSGSFDAVTMAFGIRNVPDRARALREFARVLKPGGRLAVLELSEPTRGVMGPMARWYVHELVPRIGGLISGSREYRYLQRSIAAFPPATEFASLVERAGFEVRPPQSLTFGVCHLYVGTRV